MGDLIPLGSSPGRDPQCVALGQVKCCGSCGRSVSPGGIIQVEWVVYPAHTVAGGPLGHRVQRSLRDGYCLGALDGTSDKMSPTRPCSVRRYRADREGHCWGTDRNEESTTIYHTCNRSCLDRHGGEDVLVSGCLHDARQKPSQSRRHHSPSPEDQGRRCLATSLLEVLRYSE